MLRELRARPIEGVVAGTVDIREVATNLTDVAPLDTARDGLTAGENA